jgi:hypothetical protein
MSTIPAIPDHNGAWPGSLMMTHAVIAASIAPIITACRTSDRRASQAVT